jgi:hypothetical protein
MTGANVLRFSRERRPPFRGAFVNVRTSWGVLQKATVLRDACVTRELGTCHSK